MIIEIHQVHEEGNRGLFQTRYIIGIYEYFFNGFAAWWPVALDLINRILSASFLNTGNTCWQYRRRLHDLFAVVETTHVVLKKGCECMC